MAPDVPAGRVDTCEELYAVLQAALVGSALDPLAEEVGLLAVPADAGGHHVALVHVEGPHLAADAEEQEPGAAHTLVVAPSSDIWIRRQDVITNATNFFYQAVEALRSNP